MNEDVFPKVSCIMVTADRPLLCRRAIHCYQRQRYPNKELVVLDNGKTDIERYLASIPTPELRYRKVSRTPDLILGDLRNLALEMATGDFIVPQWDDDDWYHPDRITFQVNILQNGYDACALSGTLMHVDQSPYFHKPYIGILPAGVPPTIMHRRDEAIRYPSLKRTEDTVYVDEWRQKSYYLIPKSASYLYVRSFHGSNTWEVDHFLRRIRNTPLDTLQYIWCKYVRRDLFIHPRFQLTRKMKDAFHLYLNDSIALDIFAPPYC